MAAVIDRIVAPAARLNFRAIRELLLTVPAGHEWAEAGVIAAERLLEVPFITHERGSSTRHIVEAGLQKAGIRVGSLHIVMELDSTEAILSCIEAGLGVGIVSKWALDRRLRTDSLAMIRIEGQRITRTFPFVLAQGPVVQPAVETLMRFLQNAVPAVSSAFTERHIHGGPDPKNRHRKQSDKNR